MDREPSVERVIEPSAFVLAQAAPGAHERAPRLHRFALAAVVALIAALLLALVFALPRWVASPPATTPSMNSQAIDTPAPPAAPSVAAAVPEEITVPASEAGADPAAAERRIEAQRLLQQALTQIAGLETAQAESWAKGELHEVREQVALGEKAYREQRFAAAQVYYRDAIAAAERLRGHIPGVIAALRDEAELALTNGNSARAAEAFDRILAIAPGHADATAGRARATTLDRVQALIGQAQSYERMQLTDQALATYREAASIDDKASEAAAAIARIERGQRGERLREAMSQGYAALAAADFKGAQSAFARAVAIDDKDPTALAALQQAKNAAVQRDIERALKQASAAAAGERWDEAVRAYDAALALDPELAPAQDGKVVALRRQRLDAKLRAHLAAAGRLVDDAAHADASAVLAEARKTAAAGNTLKAQIAALAEALRLARTPVSVGLRSDGATAVTIERIGEIGRFDTRRIELMPGSYAARGQRDGYRTVRIEFKVSPGASASEITIQCDEKFAAGS